MNGPLGQWRPKGWVEEAGKQGRAMAYRTVPRRPVAEMPVAVEDTESVTAGG